MSVLNELQRFEAFQSLQADSAGALSRGAQIKRVPKQTAVLQKGQAVSGAYLVMSGCLRVYTMSPSGTEATLYFIRPGESCVLALNSLFNDVLYPAWVEALEPTSVALIPGPLYRRLFESEASIRNLTVQTLSTLVYRLMGELEQVHSTHHKERLAQFLLSHAAADGSLHMTQQQVAQHLGITREVIARLLKELVTRALLRTERGRILVLDATGLRRIVWTQS